MKRRWKPPTLHNLWGRARKGRAWHSLRLPSKNKAETVKCDRTVSDTFGTISVVNAAAQKLESGGPREGRIRSKTFVCASLGILNGEQATGFHSWFGGQRRHAPRARIVLLRILSPNPTPNPFAAALPRNPSLRPTSEYLL